MSSESKFSIHYKTFKFNLLTTENHKKKKIEATYSLKTMLQKCKMATKIQEAKARKTKLMTSDKRTGWKKQPQQNEKRAP